MNESITRRTSLNTTALAGTAVGFSTLTAHAAKSNTVKGALAGCGGRGKGNLNNFQTACGILKLDCEIVALADAFEDAVQGHANQFKVSDDRCHFGWDAPGCRKVQELGEYVKTKEFGISAEDFEKGTVKLPPENGVPVPGDGKPIRRR